MSERRQFSAGQVGWLVFATVCLCLVVFLAVGGYGKQPQKPYGTQLLEKAREAGNEVMRSFDWNAASRRAADARIEGEMRRTRVAAEEAADELRRIRLRY